MNTYNLGSRIKTFDILKCIAIFFVIWGHCIQHLVSSNYEDEPVYRIIYSFHMPLFMMISGYFSVSSYQKSIIPFIGKKFRQLIIPCISWSFIICIGLALNVFFFKKEGKSLYFYAFIFYSRYWFLKSCFLCYLLGWFIYHIGHNHRYVFITICLLLSQCTTEFQLDIMFPCFIVGVELRRNNNLLKKMIQYRFTLTILFLLMLCFWGKTFWIHRGTLLNASIGLYKGSFSEFYNWLHELYRILIGIISSCAIIGLCYHYIEDRGHISTCSKYASKVGQYTLEIYCLQAILLETIIAKFLSLDSLSFFSFNFIVTPLISIIVLYACYIITKLINKSALLRFVMFGKNK